MAADCSRSLMPPVNRSFFAWKRRMSAKIALRSALALSVVPLSGNWTATASAGGYGCDCDRNCTVQHIYRCKHHCHQCPPVGMVVPSAPAYAAPLVAAPVYAAAAPVYAAPVQFAPTYAAPSYAP